MQNMYMYVYEKNVSAFCLSPKQKHVLMHLWLCKIHFTQLSQDSAIKRHQLNQNIISVSVQSL